jgi:murein endopeptidase
VVLLSLALLASPAEAQPMGPWLDTALGVALEDADEELVDCPESYLRGGIHLTTAPDLYRIWFPERAWARPEAVEVISRAAEEMAWLAPHADPLVIGDISKQGGGRIEPHMSHRGGADIDISLYWDDARAIVGDYPGASPDRLDLETNWLLIESLLGSGYIDRILLDQANIDRLKAYTIDSGHLTEDEAEAIFPERSTRNRAATGIVHHAPRHHEHMHVRVRCRAR